ncbi:MAG: T9SS type A sorting domain-containing protein [FCB group bacterium]|nr:T9SS type A sorting domain-containing protein [FCB group bacterium]MBL7027554.1 T9SS type A sorting domain-containing protein [Candidatus Neomarinimicrobiota bacterium]MBL7121184.1 T9SS type A sorting domain-containing protein [Candidatus Neomarinimicrobiota bacterium]
MNLPKWSITLLLLAFAVFAMAGENGVNSYTMGWSETHATDADVYWGISGSYDFDEDGFPEVIAYSDEGGLTLHMYENTGNDMWTEVFMYDIADAGDSYEVADEVTDLDRNGIDEFLVGGSGSSDGTLDALFIFEYDTTARTDGMLNFIEVAAVNPAEVAGITDDEGEFATSVKSLMAEDLDDDGVTEILLYDGRTHAVQVMSLDTNSTFGFPNWILEFTDVSFCCSAYGVVTGDFDNNGTNNFAMVEWDYNGISFFDVNGINDYELILFTDDLTTYDGGSLRSLDVADADGDGYDEIYLASTAGTVIMYHVGADLADFDVDTDVYEIFSYDYGFNGAKIGNTDIWHGSSDGIDYIITTDSTAIVDLEYDGIGDVTSAASWTGYEILNPDAPGEWQDVVLGDFDFDGLDEIMAANRRAPLLQVYEHDGWNTVPMVSMYSVVADTLDHPGFQTRGMTAGSDLDNDGFQEIIITDYQVHGIHVYEATSDNTLEWVATMADDSTSYWATPRHVITGDLDNNGRGEIIYMGMRALGEAYNGINVWEWDGVDGSDTYTRYVVPILVDGVEVDRYYGDRTLNTGDVDGDGANELLVAVNGSDNSSDVFVIGSIQGTFSGGFFDLVVEYSNVRTVTGDFNGSPWGQPNIGDLDGDGDLEALFVAWDHATLLVVETTAANTYELQSVTQLDSALTDKAIYGTTFVTDIDNDGADEFYCGLYSAGWVVQVDGGDDVADISYANGNVTIISDFGAPWDLAGGNADDDAEAELFTVDYTHARVYQWDYTGTGWDMSVVANWDYTMGGFALAFADDIDGDSHPEIIQGFLEPPLSSGNGYGYTFSVSEFMGTTGTDKNWTVITPDDYKLAQNFPNPFNPSTTIEFTIPLAKDNVNLTIYNMLGQEVIRLADNASYGPGTHSVSWNSLNANGTPAAAGVYIYELSSGNVSKTAKMTLIK